MNLDQFMGVGKSFICPECNKTVKKLVDFITTDKSPVKMCEECKDHLQGLKGCVFWSYHYQGVDHVYVCDQPFDLDRWLSSQSLGTEENCADDQE